MIKRLIALLSLNLLPALAFAQAYGEGAYGSGLYSADKVQIGPITLPVTGPQLVLALISAALIAAAVTLVVWYRNRKRRQQAQQQVPPVQ